MAHLFTVLQDKLISIGPGNKKRKAVPSLLNIKCHVLFPSDPLLYLFLVMSTLPGTQGIKYHSADVVCILVQQVKRSVPCSDKGEMQLRPEAVPLNLLPERLVSHRDWRRLNKKLA